MNATECEACGGESSEFVHVGMLEVAGVGGHFLCVDCVRELNLADELLAVRSRETGAALAAQALMRYYARNMIFEDLQGKLAKAAGVQILATQDHYRASVQWILSRRLREKETEAA